jgi:hypothetical protein
MRLEQTYQLLAGRHRLAVKDAPLALGEDALDQRPKVAELSAPALSRDPGEVGQPFAGLLQRCLGGPSSGNQFAIEPAAVICAAAVLDRLRALLGQAPAIAPVQLALPATSSLAATAAS